jgi:hypothetical protein
MALFTEKENYLWVDDHTYCVFWIAARNLLQDYRFACYTAVTTLYIKLHRPWSWSSQRTNEICLRAVTTKIRQSRKLAQSIVAKTRVREWVLLRLTRGSYLVYVPCAARVMYDQTYQSYLHSCKNNVQTWPPPIRATIGRKWSHQSATNRFISECSQSDKNERRCHHFREFPSGTYEPTIVVGCIVGIGSCHNTFPQRCVLL